MEWVLLGGAVAIGLILLWSVRMSRTAATVEAKAEAAYKETVERGALPPSLYPKVDLDICIGSGSCVEVCPEGDVLGLVEGKARLVNPTSCIGHGECMRACPVNAITLVLGTEKRGVDIPLVSRDFETNVPGLYIVGELGGMGLIYNAMTQALQCVDAVNSKIGKPIPGAHQLVIVGGGPAGIAASCAAHSLGLDYATLDQESMGGTVLHFPRKKLVMTRPVKLPGYGPIKVETVAKEALLDLWKDVVDVTGIEIRGETKVERVTRGADGIFDVATSKGPLRAQIVILALGRRGTPLKLGVPGEDLPKVVYRLLDPEQYVGRKCLVVGGGDAGVEAAVALAEAGATVHLSHRRKVFDRIKPKNQARLDEAVAAARVVLLLESTPKSIAEDSVTLEIGGAQEVLPNDDVLVFAGGELPAKFLAEAGVEVQKFTGQAFAPANPS